VHCRKARRLFLLWHLDKGHRAGYLAHVKACPDCQAELNRLMEQERARLPLNPYTLEQEATLDEELKGNEV